MGGFFSNERPGKDGDRYYKGLLLTTEILPRSSQPSKLKTSVNVPSKLPPTHLGHDFMGGSLYRL